MTNNDGWTALHYSALHGSFESLICFLDMGTDIQLRTNDGKNCLLYESFYENLEICKRTVLQGVQHFLILQEIVLMNY